MSFERAAFASVAAQGALAASGQCLAQAASTANECESTDFTNPIVSPRREPTGQSFAMLASRALSFASASEGSAFASAAADLQLSRSAATPVVRRSR